jgi:hypothetical protein
MVTCAEAGPLLKVKLNEMWTYDGDCMLWHKVALVISSGTKECQATGSCAAGAVARKVMPNDCIRRMHLVVVVLEG